jgi:RNA polymerase sigma factor (sigma-70 family)
MGIDSRLQKLYTENRPKIFNMVKSNSGTEEEAKDLLQDGIAVVWEKFKNENPNNLKCSLGTFLYSVCRNMWLNQLRKKGKSPLRLLNESISNESPNDDELDLMIETDQKIILIEKGIKSLGETCRKLLRMFYYEESSMDKIANTLGLSNTNAAKTKKYKCMQQLKRKVA